MSVLNSSFEPLGLEYGAKALIFGGGVGSLCWMGQEVLYESGYDDEQLSVTYPVVLCILTMSIAFLAPIILRYCSPKESNSSIMENKKIDADKGVVALVVRDRSSNHDECGFGHAVLAIEIFKRGRKRIYLADFMPIGDGKGKAFLKLCKTDFSKYLSSSQGATREVKGGPWEKDSVSINKMLKWIKDDTRKVYRYETRGKGAIGVGDKCHNCMSWAGEALKPIGQNKAVDGLLYKGYRGRGEAFMEITAGVTKLSVDGIVSVGEKLESVQKVCGEAITENLKRLRESFSKTLTE